MIPEFRAQVTRILAAYYGIPADRIAQPGTTLRPVGSDEWDDWLELTNLLGEGFPAAVRERLTDPFHLREVELVLPFAFWVTAFRLRCRPVALSRLR